MANRVAVVDDDPENLRALSALLQAEGFEVAAYAGGETAWAALNTGCNPVPEAIITDLRMPGLDGLGLLRRLRERFPTLPVILVSAFPDEAVWREGLEAGALDVFPKPFQTASMIALLRAAIERARPSEAAETPDPLAPGGRQFKEESMRTLAACLLAVALLWGGAALANDVEGTIQAIDPGNMVVVLDDGTALIVEDSTTLTMDGQRAKLEDLQPGGKVTASYDEKDGKNIASSLDAHK